MRASGASVETVLRGGPAEAMRRKTTRSTGSTAMPRTARHQDWTKPAAMAIPKEGFFKDKVQQGRYGPIFPKTPACYGFTIIAKIKRGREEVIREYGKTIE